MWYSDVNTKNATDTTNVNEHQVNIVDKTELCDYI